MIFTPVYSPLGLTWILVEVSGLWFRIRDPCFFTSVPTVVITPLGARRGVLAPGQA
jgi:hypothetical protein